MNKKAMRYTIVIGLTIGVLILAFTLYIWVKFGNLLVKRPVDDINYQSLDRLSYDINRVIEGEKKFLFNSTVSLSKDFSFYSFNKNQDGVEARRGGVLAELIKPPSCAEQACLCMYQEPFKGQECKPIKADYIVTVDYKDWGIDILNELDHSWFWYTSMEVVSDIEGPLYNGEIRTYKQFAFYNYDQVSDTHWGNLGLYIEKFKTDNGLVVFISPMTSYTFERSTG